MEMLDNTTSGEAVKHRRAGTGLRAVAAVLAALVLALLLELGLFNRHALAGMGQAWTPLPEPEISGDLSTDQEVTLRFSRIEQTVSRCHLEIYVRTGQGNPVPTELILSLSDEGSAVSYEAGRIAYTVQHNKSAWFPLSAYGKVHDLTVTVKAPSPGCSCELRAAEINGAIPFRVSPLRTAALFCLFLLLYCLRPGSPLYDNRLWNRQRGAKLLCVLLTLLLCLSGLGLLTRVNTPFASIPEDPNWAHHHQYAKLARALAEGRTWIEEEADGPALSVLAQMKDPYDESVRYNITVQDGIRFPWDTAYYQGHLYVYFGVVPVLLTYLPWYLLTGSDLPTVYAVLCSFGLVLLGAFLLLRGLIRRYFPRTPFLLYLLLSLLFGCCSCVILYALVPGFYVLPITFSLAFACFALALWLSAAERWALRLNGPQASGEPDALCFAPLRGLPRSGSVNRRLLPGAFFAALTAGCRPQYLVFSLLALPIFLPLVRQEGRLRKGLPRMLLLALPYLAVALPLMYYNQLRFGSPFDFGANYNLTTNNMPLRGWQPGRLPDGLWEYLFRTPDLDLSFPYVHSTASRLLYLGNTIREPMYGGALLLHPFLWIFLCYGRVRPGLRRRGLRALVLLPPALALAVIAADTEMAGILLRYMGDFLPLLYLSSILIFLTCWEEGSASLQRRLKLFLPATLCVTAALCFLISVSDGSLITRVPETFYRLKDFLS